MWFGRCCGSRACCVLVLGVPKRTECFEQRSTSMPFSQRVCFMATQINNLCPFKTSVLVVRGYNRRVVWRMYMYNFGSILTREAEQQSQCLITHTVFPTSSRFSNARVTSQQNLSKVRCISYCINPIALTKGSSEVLVCKDKLSQFLKIRGSLLYQH